MVATPTTPPAGRAADSPANRRASTGGERWSEGEHPAPGRRERFGQADGRAELPNRERCRSGGFPGDRRGAAAPLARARMFYIASAGLPTLTVESQPSAKPPKPPLRARSGAASTGPSRASSAASRLPVSRTARATGDPVTSLAIAALPADRRFSPYLYPSGSRDRRSWAILEPVDYPKCLRAAPKRPLSRSQGQIRSRGLLSGPPDRPPSPP